MLSVTPDLVIGIGLGLLAAALLVGSQTLLGPILRLSPCGCIANLVVGAVLVVVGFVLLVASGTLRLE